MSDDRGEDSATTESWIGSSRAGLENCIGTSWRGDRVADKPVQTDKSSAFKRTEEKRPGRSIRRIVVKLLRKSRDLGERYLMYLDRALKKFLVMKIQGFYFEHPESAFYRWSARFNNDSKPDSFGSKTLRSEE